MKSRTSFCNSAVLKRTIHKGLPLWGLYLLLMLIFLPIVLCTDQWRDALALKNYILSFAANASQPIGALYGFGTACFVFSWMYKSRSANFFGALPLSRTSLFATHYLAGLLFVVIPNLLAALLAVPACLTESYWAVGDLALWFTVMTLAYLFYYSFAVLVAMVAGNLIALPLLYAILNFTVVVLEAIIRDLLEYFVYGLWFSGDFRFSWASPLYYTILESNGPGVRNIWNDVTGKTTDYIFEGWPFVLILGAIGVVFAVLAFLLHNRRRMESAGDFIAIRRLKPVFLFCFTIGCSIVLGYGLANVLLGGDLGTRDFWKILLCMVAGGFVGYFAGRMVLLKSIRVFGRKQHWIQWGAISLALAALLLCAHMDVLGYASYVPAAEDVVAISLDNYGGRYHEDPTFIDQVTGFHRLCLDRRQEVETMEPEEGFTRSYIIYRLKDGSTVQRRYLIPISKEEYQQADSLVLLQEQLFNDPAYKLVRELPRNYTASDIEHCRIDIDKNEELSLTRQEAYDFLKTCLEPDLQHSTMENSAHSDYSPYARCDYTTVYVELKFTRSFMDGTDLDDRYYFFTITVDAAHTLDYITEQGLTWTLRS